MSGPSFDNPSRAAPSASPTRPEPEPVRRPQRSEPTALLDGLETKYEARAKHLPSDVRDVASSLRAARHAFDETKSTASTGEVAAQARMAALHIDHAAHLAGHQPSDELISQGTLVGQSLIRFVEQARRAHLEITKEDAFVQLGASYAKLKQALTLPDVERSAHYVKELGTDASYHTPLVHHTLQRIATTAEQGLGTLSAKSIPERDATVDEIASHLEAYAVYVDALVEGTPAGKRGAFRADAVNASAHFERLRWWIQQRPANRRMLQRLHTAKTSFNATLTRLDLPLLQKSTAGSDHDELTAIKTEEGAVQSSMARFVAALDSVEAREREGVNTVEKLASLENNPRPPSFIESLIVSTFVAVVGNLGAQILGTLAGKAASVMSGIPDAIKGLPPAADMIQIAAPVRDLSLLGDIASDTIQPIVSGALGDSSKETSQARARVFFMSGLRLTASDRIAKLKVRMRDRIKANDIAAHELDALSSILEDTQALLHEHYFRNALHAWTTYVAQASLGSKGRGKAAVANMDHYFGGHRGPYRDPLTAKNGRDGVLHVHLHVDPDGTRPRVAHDKTEIVGMNDDLAKEVAKAAGHRLSKVPLPKEVHVHTRSGIAVIAIDERDQVRDSRDWGGAIARETGILQAERFWRVWGEGVAI